VNVIREDPKNASLLYVGNEFGVYVSLDGGRDWKRFMTGLPTVRVDDLLVHPRENDLIVGTHGRSIWIVDDITPLQQWAAVTQRRETSSSGHDGAEAQVSAALPDAHLFDVRPAVQWKTDVMLSRTVGAAKHFRGENPGAGTYVNYYLRSPSSGGVKITVSDITGKVLRNLTGTNDAGINRVRWNLRHDPPPPSPGAQQAGGGQQGQQPQQGPPVEHGTYLIKVTTGGRELTRTLVVEEDIWLKR
jgi:hypothetical protein